MGCTACTEPQCLYKGDLYLLFLVYHRTGHEGPKREKYSYTLSLTSPLNGGGWSASRSRRFTPGKDPVPIVQEAGWAPGQVWQGAENLVPTGIRSPDRQCSLENQGELDRQLLLLL